MEEECSELWPRRGSAYCRFLFLLRRGHAYFVLSVHVGLVSTPDPRWFCVRDAGVSAMSAALQTENLSAIRALYGNFHSLLSLTQNFETESEMAEERTEEMIKSEEKVT